MEFINKNPKIFIISGKAESGKDEIGKVIEKFYANKKCKKLSYAYYLKQYVKDISGWDGSENNKPRDLLQSMGIDFLKKEIDEQFLIRRICEDIKVYSYFYDILIITDARLPEEVEIPKKIFSNIITIRVNRLMKNHLTESQRRHITEIGLDNYNYFDYVIENYENYDKLIDEVEKILIEVNNNE